MRLKIAGSSACSAARAPSAQPTMPSPVMRRPSSSSMLRRPSSCTARPACSMQTHMKSKKAKPCMSYHAPIRPPAGKSFGDLPQWRQHAEFYMTLDHTDDPEGFWMGLGYCVSANQLMVGPQAELNLLGNGSDIYALRTRALPKAGVIYAFTIKMFDHGGAPHGGDGPDDSVGGRVVAQHQVCSVKQMRRIMAEVYIPDPLMTALREMMMAHNVEPSDDDGGD